MQDLGRAVNLKFPSSLSASSRSDATSSSGYESMRNDASHASSDSCSEKGLSRRGKRKGMNWIRLEPLVRSSSSRLEGCYGKGNVILRSWCGRRSYCVFVKICPEKSHYSRNTHGAIWDTFPRFI